MGARFSFHEMPQTEKAMNPKPITIMLPMTEAESKALQEFLNNMPARWESLASNRGVRNCRRLPKALAEQHRIAVANQK